MSTTDVPGANKKNQDELHIGCWAEHADGSLILVKGIENNNVVFEVYAVEHAPPVVYTDSMPRAGFEKRFSYTPTGSSREKWTWHDKTSFPWDKVMEKHTRLAPSAAHAVDMLSAAERLAQDLNLRRATVNEHDISHRTDVVTKRGNAVVSRIKAAWNELTN